MEQNLAMVQGGDQSIMPILTPQEQVEKASEMAKVLQTVVKQANLARNFGGKKDHLEYEAWQTIAQFFNCTPQTEWTHPIIDKDKIVGYESRVNVVNSDGRIIASAESMCMRDEPNWKNKPLYALRSMAQTRTAGKAMRSVFAWVAVLAGYSATPAEEMSTEFYDSKPRQTHPQTSKSSPQSTSAPVPYTEAQRKKLFAMMKKKELNDSEMKSFSEYLKTKVGTTTDENARQVFSKSEASEIFDNFDSLFDEYINGGEPEELEQDEIPY